MNPGDLKNTFTDKDGVERTVVIPAEVFRQARREGTSNKVAIDRYLVSKGFLEETAVEETAKAKKTRTRKPNETKRKIMDILAQAVADDLITDYIETVNPERQIRFSLEGKIFELTLVQKRK